MSFTLDGAGLVHANGHRALHRLTLSASAGEQLAVIGPSGAGKTTLLRLLGSSLKPTEGRVATLGTDPWTLSAPALRQLRAKVGMVHQSPPIPPRLRVVTAVLAGRLGSWPLARSLGSLLYPRDVEGAHRALVRVDLGERLFDRCDRLSGGQLQRVGIARVLYQQPALLLADEPVSALDPTLADVSVAELVAQSRSSGATLVASLHAVDIALKWFPRVVGMRAGRVVFDLPRRDVTTQLLQQLYANEAMTAGVALPESMAGEPGEAGEPGDGPDVRSRFNCR